MTGFARSQGYAEAGAASGKWAWEIRSVNARSLDIRLRLPSGFEHLEQVCRAEFSKRTARGNVQATFSFDRDASQSVPVINENALQAVLTALDALRERIGSPPPAAEAILSLRGVLEYGEEEASSAETDQRDGQVLAGLEAALVELVDARQGEGAAIGKVLLEQVEEIERLTQRIESDPSRSANALRTRLRQQLAPLLDVGAGLDPQRLHQEAAILATKADLSEEIDRLTAHIQSARSILSSAGPAGRKLDFLAQEFNRECNTICSKSNAAEVTAAGLEMKVVIDRFREQVQNLE